MRRRTDTKGGPLEVAADEAGVIPGVVSIKAGPGLFVTFFLSPDEAEEIGNNLRQAAAAALHAKERELNL